MEVFMRNLKTLSLATASLILLGLAQPNNGWSDSIGDKVKEYIDNATEALKNGIDKLEGNFAAIQDYLDHYPWKGIIQTEATSGPVTVGHLKLNGHSKAIVAAPGQTIAAEVKCAFDPDKSTFFGHYEIVIGLKGLGPQVVIGSEGLADGKTKEEFTLVAPETRGIYEIRFRPAKIIFKLPAFSEWLDSEGHEPDAKTTIGLIVVK